MSIYVRLLTTHQTLHSKDIPPEMSEKKGYPFEQSVCMTLDIRVSYEVLEFRNESNIFLQNV